MNVTGALRGLTLLFVGVLAACRGSAQTTVTTAGSSASSEAGGARSDVSARHPVGLPLALVADVPLPGPAVRFDYQDFDVAKGRLVIAHMNDASLVVVNAADGATVKILPNIPTARGVVVADDVGRIFVTSSPNQLVIIDNSSLAEVARVDTGISPDGVGWDPVHQVVGVSDQGGKNREGDLAPCQPPVAVDAATHRVFFPLAPGSKGTPVLRIMRPSGA